MTLCAWFSSGTLVNCVQSHCFYFNCSWCLYFLGSNSICVILLIILLIGNIIFRFVLITLETLKCKDITREKYNNECGTNMVGFDLPHCCDPIISTLLRLKRHHSFHCSIHLLKMHLFVIFFNYICQYTASCRFVVEIHSINLFAFTVSLKQFTRISADYDETGVERGGHWTFLLVSYIS